MLFTKVFKYKKLIFCVMIIMGIAFYYITHTTGSPIDYSHAVRTDMPISSIIKDSGVIDKELVIRSLKSTSQLVGESGHVTKHYTYFDSIFKSHGWLADHLGQRSVEMDYNAYFKMGINLSDITQDSVKIYGNSIFITLPKTVLISMDVPYNEIIYSNHTGLLRSAISETDKQIIYKEVRKIVTDNVMNDNTIINKSVDGVKSALQSLLEKIPNCNRIIFRSVIE